MIKPLITEDDVLHDLLDQVFTSDATDSESALLRRARHVVELRLAFDELQTTQVPPKLGLRLNYKNADGVVPEENASTFAALVANRLAGQKNEATAIRNVSEAKTPLRTLERKVDRDDKRLYKAWTKSYLDDTTEGDAARPQIPTATAMPAHTALLTSDADSGLHAATPELPWRLPGDVDFSHTIPVVLTGQTVGPFAPNTLVTFRVRTSNSIPGVALSASKAVLVS